MRNRDTTEADDISPGDHVLVVRRDGSKIYIKTSSEPFQKMNGNYVIAGMMMPMAKQEIYIPTFEVDHYISA